MAEECVYIYTYIYFCANDCITDDLTTVSDNQSQTKKEIGSVLLCFIQYKTKVMSFDHLVNICSSFYKWAEVTKAKNVLHNLVDNRVGGKTKGTEKEHIKKTVSNLTRVCLNLKANLPNFYATDLNRLSSVSIEHVDVCALL